MNKLFTKQKAPLFNRAKFKFDLKPLNQKTIWQIQFDLGVNDSVQYITNYCILGGIAFYYELLETNQTLNSAQDLFFGLGPLNEEGQDILRQEFGSAYKTYFSILQAIGSGMCSPAEISSKLGLQSTTLSKYIFALRYDFKLIEKIVSFGQNPTRSKKGIYVIKDNLLSFWFSFVYGKFQAPQKGELNSFIGRRFEFLCTEFFLNYLESKKESVMLSSRWWGSVQIAENKFEQRDIDIVVETKDCLYLCECKWSDKKIDDKILNHLIESSSAIKTKKQKRYVIFSKNKSSIKPQESVLLFSSEDITKF
jgi:hypothetical protein